MDLNTLANLGEFVAGIGVIISLIYLSVQVRQNTFSVRANTHQAFSDAAGDSLQSIYMDAEVSRLFSRALFDPESLDDEEWFRFRLIATRIIRHFESAFFQHRLGTMDPELWKGLERSIAEWCTRPGMSKWIVENEHRLSEPLREWIKTDVPRIVAGAG